MHGRRKLMALPPLRLLSPKTDAACAQAHFASTRRICFTDRELDDGGAEQLAHRTIAGAIVWGKDGKLPSGRRRDRRGAVGADYEGSRVVAKACVALAVFLLGVAMFRVTLLVGAVQIASGREMHRDFSDLAHPGGKCIDQYGRNQWE